MLKTGSERAKSSRCERDGPKIKHPKQGATRVRGVFQQPVKPRFLPAAEAELLKEVAYYSIARDGLGVKFEHAVESPVKKAVANPDGGAPSLKGTRSRLVKGFPFSVVYRASDTEILVVAIMHHRREPGYWAVRVA